MTKNDVKEFLEDETKAYFVERGDCDTCTHKTFIAVGHPIGWVSLDKFLRLIREVYNAKK